MEKRVLFLSLFCGLFCLSTLASASASSYSASVSVTGFELDPLWQEYVPSTIENNDPGPNPPVSAALQHKFFLPNGVLSWGFSDLKAEGSNSLLRVTGYSEGGEIASKAKSNYETDFLANYSRLKLSYNYYLWCFELPDIGYGVAWGNVYTNVTLFDKTDNLVAWSHKLTKNGSAIFEEDLLPITGKIEELLSLSSGHNYSLTVGVSLDYVIYGDWNYETSGFFRKIYGEAYISNLSLSPVPLPSTIILFGVGLGQLVLHNRRKRTAAN